MEIQFTGRHHMEITDAIREYTTEKLAPLKKYFDQLTSITVTFDADHNKSRHSAEAHLHLPGTDINAHAETTDMYKTINILADKLVHQLQKYKEKHSDHR